MDASNKPELLIVTGMSGAGRSTTGNALEDQGWHVIDNLPPQLLFPISDLFSTSSEALTKVAVVTDVRGGQFFADLEQNIQKLKSHDISVRVLFLEANDAALVKRFESVRRPHPLQGEGTVLDGIAAERAKLLTLRETADIVFDTSESNVHELSNRVAEAFAGQSKGFKVNLMSFWLQIWDPRGRRHGRRRKVHRKPALARVAQGKKQGMTSKCPTMFFSQPGVKDFEESYLETLKIVLAGYQRENKRFATIAIGCTGGKHRSVALTNEIAARLAETQT